MNDDGFYYLLKRSGTMEAMDKLSLTETLVIHKVAYETNQVEQPIEWARGLTMRVFADSQQKPVGEIIKAVDTLLGNGMLAREKDGVAWKYKLNPEFWGVLPTEDENEALSRHSGTGTASSAS